MDLPWWLDPPTNPTAILTKLEARFHMLKSQTDEGAALRGLLKSLVGCYQDAIREAKAAVPIAFFKPSYEQALMLNCWLYGINFPVCFASNRIGKTTCFVINALLWILPNDPGWIMFQPYTDYKGRTVVVVPRPTLRALVPLQRFYVKNPHLVGDPKQSHLTEPNASLFVTSQSEAPGYFRPCYPAAPIQRNSTIWLGAPSLDWHKDIMMKRWRDWLPKYVVKRDSASDCIFELDTRSTTNPKPTTISVICKSYEAKDEKWSGDAVVGIMLSEGFSPDILEEIKPRLVEHAFASWDYTPVESINQGRKVQLAHNVYKGKEQLPLRAHIFTKFRLIDAPDFIIPLSKKEDMIRNYENKDSGKARIEGDFFSSSRNLLAHFKREQHCLDISFSELQRRFQNLKLYRSIDPGYDHPTACAWMALAPNNCWYVYRFLSESGMSIPERCERIIKMSYNAREKVSYGTGENDFYWQEVHPYQHSEAYILTVCDYHQFVIDQSTKRNQALNYTLEGLPIVESVHVSPADRVLDLDKKLDPSAYPYHTHPVRGTTPGAGVYFLINEPGVGEAVDQMESLYWETLQGGPNKGQAKDAPPNHGDDELDAVCQITSSPYRYDPLLKAVRREPTSIELEKDIVEAAYSRSRSYHFGSGADPSLLADPSLQPGRPGVFA